MKIKPKRLNSKGFSHHFVIPVIAITLIGGIGAYIVTRPKAAQANPLKSKALCESITYNRVWKNKTCTKDCKSGYVLIASNPYDFCTKYPSAKKLLQKKSVRIKEAFGWTYGIRG